MSLFYTTSRFCRYHNEWQAEVEEPWIVCYECNHVYNTEKELLQAVKVRWGTKYDYGSDVLSCPYCIHDF